MSQPDAGIGEERIDDVPLFGRNRPVPPTEEELQAAEVDRERIRQGGIPLGAEQRLKRIASASTPFFTSDLSAKEYALAQAGGLQPLAQVMGSSVVQHGWVRSGGYYWNTGEVHGLSEPWNLARDRAFGRLRQEAELAGADGVIGIEVSGGSGLAGPGNVELVVFGTAVRDNAFPSHGERQLGMCTLSGQEVDKLRRIGAEVRAVVGHTSVIAVQLMPSSAWVMNAGGMFNSGARMNIEIPEISQGVYLARQRVMSEVRQQASAVGANDIVISMLQHTIEHREYEQTGYTRHFFYVTMNVLGTAIRLGTREPYPRPLPDPIMSINLGAS